MRGVQDEQSIWRAVTSALAAHAVRFSWWWTQVICKRATLSPGSTTWLQTFLNVRTHLYWVGCGVLGVCSLALLQDYFSSGSHLFIQAECVRHANSKKDVVQSCDGSQRVQKTVILQGTAKQNVITIKVPLLVSFRCLNQPVHCSGVSLHDCSHLVKQAWFFVLKCYNKVTCTRKFLSVLRNLL